MSGDRAPALVSSVHDLINYHVKDGSPVDPGSTKGYQERFIHSEIYKRFPDINSVIHSHSAAVLPYTMSGVEMKPVFHIAGFLGIRNTPSDQDDARNTLTIAGNHVPVYDILPLYSPEDQQDMLVNNTNFGAHLAATFSSADSSSQDHNVVLMSNHGFTAVGNSVKQAVYRAVYTHVNAGIQTNALLLRNAAGPSSSGVGTGGLRYLNEKQVQGSLKMNDASQDRPWGLWLEEIKACNLYPRQGDL
jgi:ribulose-5-phosphate 4-epimerase/fuculose-1-phosphate aldolase